MTNKRENYLEWADYFMSIAFLSAQRSKDPRTQVGACIVNKDNQVLGIGYNGMPIGCSDDLIPWNRTAKAGDDNKEAWLQSKTPYVCHAELNAVLNKNAADIKGCTMYVALFPCNLCAQIIIQSGITEVVYYSDKYHGKPETKASRFLLDTAKVKYRQYQPKQKKIIIDFDLIEETPGQAPTLPTMNSCSNYLLTTNNNNTGLMKKANLENHAEQQQLQQINQIQAQAPVQPSTDWLQTPQSSLQPNEAMEMKFAIISISLIIFVAFISWYLAHAKLVIDIR